MTKELKTLKELWKEKDYTMESGEKIFIESDLRQSGIDWIKAWIRFNKKSDLENTNIELMSYMSRDVALWIINYFNIQPEEIKNAPTGIS